MRVNLAPGWKTDLDRGPDWLFVRIYGPDGAGADAKGLADNVREMLQQELKSRVLLELEHVAQVPGDFADELVQLCDQLERDGAVFRLCGLPETHHRFLRERHFEHRHFRNRNEALTNTPIPGKPR